MFGELNILFGAIWPTPNRRPLLVLHAFEHKKRQVFCGLLCAIDGFQQMDLTFGEMRFIF